MNYKILFVFLLIILSFKIYSKDENFVFNANNIQNPREKNGTWITVYNNYLTQEEINSINNEISQIEKETTAEIAVLVIPNTGGNILDASKQIFNKWGIGKKNKNNGLLLVASIDERLFRTQTGYGFESLFTEARCLNLHEHLVIPAFREELYGKGILDYIKKIHYILTNPDYFDLIEKEEKIQKQKFLEETNKREFRDKLTGFIILHVFVLLFYISGIIILIVTGIKTAGKIKKEYNRYSLIKGLDETGLIHYGFSILMIVLFLIGGMMSLLGFYNMKLFPEKYYYISYLIPGTGILSVFLINFFAITRKKAIINKWRKGPRMCPECNSMMKKLSETEDDSFLNKGEIAEENLKTKDYDVWICDKCKNKTIEDFRAWKYFLYITCSKCGKISVKQTGSRLVTRANYKHSGTRRLEFSCFSCGYKYDKNITIPQLVRSSSSSYTSSSSSNSSSSSTGSSSSNSSSSFGGGSSGGGGATSGW